ncbi:hypothetical protein M2390_000311 [Mycetocola sp. BIGb0189]|uniref:hypothetical protein n=1 Tax=Mycetocola sp. BIGb0189 TaxID=2940604 RepID=UPI002169437C|nr:hypothetical protein [Mycetocola sp. BIGb0189]MCS4275153.1 hypothetical protein [Mycetocola sp. BIGb0189]
MPRLTNNDFLMRHRFLKRLWEDEHLKSLYGLLAPNEQWDVHQYYQTINTGSDTEIIETRTTVNTGDESLPQCAGRAYAKLFYAFQQISAAMDISVSNPEEALPRIEEAGIEYRRRLTQRARKTGPGSKKNSRHYIQPIMKPNFDVDQYVKIVLGVAEHLMNEERKKEGKPPLNLPIYRKP